MVVGIEVKTNVEDAAKMSRSLTDELPENADDAAEIISQEFIKEATLAMRQNGSIVTGTGVRSFETVKTGFGRRKVLGADYLLALHTGTPPHPPDTSNNRYQIWARQHGFTPSELAEIIKNKGTEPHPWIDRTFRRIRGKSPRTVEMKLSDAATSSQTIL